MYRIIYYHTIKLMYIIVYENQPLMIHEYFIKRHVYISSIISQKADQLCTSWWNDLSESMCINGSSEFVEDRCLQVYGGQMLYAVIFN